MGLIDIEIYSINIKLPTLKVDNLTLCPSQKMRSLSIMSVFTTNN